jgi:hypothetical protein
MGLKSTVSRLAFSTDPGKPEKRDEDDRDKSPETPLDEPRPPRVQDPPPQPDTKGPYVVSKSRQRTEG